MTRKDYELIAAAIARTEMARTIGKPLSAAQTLRLAATDLAASLAADNPRFGRERFLQACGVQS